MDGYAARQEGQRPWHIALTYSSRGCYWRHWDRLVLVRMVISCLNIACRVWLFSHGNIQGAQRKVELRLSGLATAGIEWVTTEIQLFLCVNGSDGTNWNNWMEEFRRRGSCRNRKKIDRERSTRVVSTTRPSYIVHITQHTVSTNQPIPIRLFKGKRLWPPSLWTDPDLGKWCDVAPRIETYTDYWCKQNNVSIGDLSWDKNYLSWMIHPLAKSQLTTPYAYWLSVPLSPFSSFVTEEYLLNEAVAVNIPLIFLWIYWRSELNL